MGSSHRRSHPLFAGSGTAHAQSGTYARLVGTVTDQTGAVLPGVEVTATARATNVPKMALTNERGDYIIDKLIPGAYDARAELPGFKTQISQNFRLEVTQVGRRDFEMTPGEISEQVTVMGQSPIIDTDAVEVASLIEGKEDSGSPSSGARSAEAGLPDDGCHPRRDRRGRVWRLLRCSM